MQIENEDLSGKLILEVGSGRGATTRKLIDLLDGKPNAQLIITDISDQFFEQLSNEFRTRNVQIKFICTGAHELQNIPNHSIDFVVCNYTLCAVNSQAGLIALALRRFWEVLKFGGKLFVEEEFPISKQDTPLQEVWAEKWRILKAGMILAGAFPYNEIDPELLANLCRLAGFEKVEWTKHIEKHHEISILDFFDKRLNALAKKIPTESLRAAFSDKATLLRSKFGQVGGMEIPFYRLVAQKRTH